MINAVPKLNDFATRRTIADALNVLAARIAFKSSDRAQIEISPLALPWGELAWLLFVVFESEREPLPCSSKFHAIRAGSERTEIFETSRLKDATVDGRSQVTLNDGTQLRAVEILPAISNVEPSELDYFIVHALVQFNKAEAWCYRNLADDLPPGLREEVTADLRFLDFNRLHELKIPGLKELAGFVADTTPDLPPISEQKVADALKTFGLRIPRPRPRVVRHTPP